VYGDYVEMARNELGCENKISCAILSYGEIVRDLLPGFSKLRLRTPVRVQR
jgi:hypothetical protein